MRAAIGVDLGSTTSKALILDEQGGILGRGITNSRSNYDVAVDVARTEAVIGARFALLDARLRRIQRLAPIADRVTGALSTELRIAQHLRQMDHLGEAILGFAEQASDPGERAALREAAVKILDAMRAEVRKRFRFGWNAASFFRDLAASEWMRLAQEAGRAGGPSFDSLANLFDKSIIRVENRGLDLSFEANIRGPFETVLARFGAELGGSAGEMRTALAEVLRDPLDLVASVGTGYGRARLPFPKDRIRSEILCHGLGAHRMFPGTRTVLDIGGQDTKAIQTDERGIVTSFQMNDRCAAGCGRYLGYIAAEMSLGVHELGPMADKSCHPTRINSTCTVFAGAELRDRLTMGEKNEDILAGLHRAMILRAMSLLARSGGVQEELTFTGGVANNSAAVKALRDLVAENYGARTINISPDSIFTGALGAATFAWRESFGQEAAA